MWLNLSHSRSTMSRLVAYMNKSARYNSFSDFPFIFFQEVNSFVSSALECTERVSLGLIVLTVQIFCPAGQNR